jgi:hypothetical protein
MTAGSSRDKSGDTENCQAWLARPAPFRHVHPMDNSNARPTEATFTGSGKPVSFRVAGRDFDFCQPPGTSTAQAEAHDLPVGIAPRVFRPPEFGVFQWCTIDTPARCCRALPLVQPGILDFTIIGSHSMYPVAPSFT